MSQDSDVARQYWRKNLKIISLLLTIWAVVSLGFGIALAPWLNQFQLPGTEFPLGFWFAQQGSIFTFVILIFVYAWRMNRLDDEFSAGQDGQ
jgi:putative solute:sodium symporter small subunit